LADLNGDGLPDLAALGQGSADGGYPEFAMVLLGAPDAGFQAPTTIPLCGNPAGLAAIDSRGSGHLDLVMRNSDLSSVGILVGDGTGSFQSETAACSCQLTSLAWGDLNGDGLQDLVVSSPDPSATYVLFGQ
jgi:hypothetical protein